MCVCVHAREHNHIGISGAVFLNELGIYGSARPTEKRERRDGLSNSICIRKSEHNPPRHPVPVPRSSRNIYGRYSEERKGTTGRNRC